MFGLGLRRWRVGSLEWASRAFFSVSTDAFIVSSSGKRAASVSAISSARLSSASRGSASSRFTAASAVARERADCAASRRVAANARDERMYPPASAAASAGLQELRIAEYPGAFASHTREELLENTRKVLWPQIKAGLMGGSRSSATADAQKRVPPAFTGTFAEIQKIFLDSGWTDGLPIVPPTEKAVAEFRLTTDLKPDTPAARPRKMPTHTGGRGDRPYGTRQQRNGARYRDPQR